MCVEKLTENLKMPSNINSQLNVANSKVIFKPDMNSLPNEHTGKFNVNA